MSIYLKNQKGAEDEVEIKVIKSDIHAILRSHEN